MFEITGKMEALRPYERSAINRRTCTVDEITESPGASVVDAMQLDGRWILVVEVKAPAISAASAPGQSPKLWAPRSTQSARFALDARLGSRGSASLRRSRPIARPAEGV